MKALTKGFLGAAALVAAGMLTACGGGGGSKASNKGYPVTGQNGGTVIVIVHGGYWGYYSGLTFCSLSNNYCGSGLNYGISADGLTYDGVYYTSGPTSSGTSGGTTSGGTSGGTTSGGTTSGGSYSGGTTSGGSYSGGSYSGGSYSGGSYSGGSYSGGSYSGGSYSGGSYSGGSYSGGSYSSGSSGGYYTSSGESVGQNTTDVNLQRGLAQNAQLDAMAQATATQFQMSFESARELTQLANKMQIMQQNGQLSDDDRAALARSALAVAGVEESEVNEAVAKAAQGDKAAVDTVMTKAATNLGMPSSAMLRDQILPSFGISVP